MCSKLLNYFKIASNCNIFRSVHTRILNMDKAYIRKLENSDEFQLTFHYLNREMKTDRQFNFCRQLKENVSVCLNRVSVNVGKVINKKNKKRKKNDTDENTETTVNVQLQLDGTDVNGEILCEELFKNQSNNIVLKLLDKEYKIVINAPWVDNISLPSSILANFPTYPIKFESVFTNKNLSDFEWYKSEDKTKWTSVGNGFIYLPSNSDINSYLKLACTPKNENAIGPTNETISEVKVEASPGHCPFEDRHQFTQERATGKEFRVVSYNILADLYCDSDFSRTTLFPYCPPYALNIDYRKQLVLKELIGYNADIICLQELDKKVYVNDIQPVFNSLNYDSTFQLKGGLVAEGLACIFNGNRFRHLESNCIILGEQIDKNSLFADIWQKVSKNKQLGDRVLQRSTAVQTTALESLEHDEILLIANTHLYFHPDADHIRLLQGGLAIRFIHDTIEKLKQKTTKSISLVFCGDFNSVPECGIYQLYTKGEVSEDCIDWKSNKEEAVEGVSLHQPLHLESACGTPQYTNYTAGFSGCLDYIYYDTSKLKVAQVIPLPSHEEITEHVAIPSVVFPSDHIALVADLKWS